MEKITRKMWIVEEGAVRALEAVLYQPGSETATALWQVPAYKMLAIEGQDVFSNRSQALFELADRLREKRGRLKDELALLEDAIGMTLRAAEQQLVLEQENDGKHNP